MAAIGSYFRTLTDRFGRGWNEFWFAPSDPLTLSVIRVLTALVALGLYLSYWPDFDQFFGPGGLLSREEMFRIRGDVPIFSLYDHIHTLTGMHVAYWIGAGAIGLLLVGLFTRVTAVLALLAYLSLIHRGPLLARPVDDIVAMLMFYLCIGPCGWSLSLDACFGLRPRAKLNGGQSVPTSWTATLALRLMQVHLVAIYAAMAMAKLKIPIWWSGTAVWNLIARPDWPLADMRSMGHWGMYLINAWTHVIVLFEICFPILIWNRLARPLLLGLAIPIWIGTAVLTGMTSFALIMLVANLAFVAPGAFRCCFGRQAASA